MVKPLKRIDVQAVYEDDDDIILFEGDINNFKVVHGESVMPMISILEFARAKNNPQITAIKELDFWILSLNGIVDDVVIADVIDMEVSDYENYLIANFLGFHYIQCIAFKEQTDALAAVDWVNSKILMQTLKEKQDDE